jgi:phage terminase large subunit GpA-like protein
MARSRTFSRRKAFIVSTPTLDGASKIDEEWLSSDQRKYFVPCPHCNHFQYLKFKQLRWTEGKPNEAQYECEECTALIEEKNKTEMLSKGEWRKKYPESKTAGFHINSLYSPLGWYSWAEIAKDYEAAKKQLEQEHKTELMRTFVNTVLGETYKEVGDAPEWKRLYLRRENYEIGTCPEKVCFLTAGVDVQKDRLECEVVGWGQHKESWSVEYIVFIGDTSAEKVWDDLQSYIEKSFVRDDDQELPIQVVGIDSGYNTQQVYNFVRKFSASRVIAFKGSDQISVPVSHPRIVDVKIKGKSTVRRGVKVWNVGVNVLKAELYGWLKLDPPIGEEKTPSGFCHFPQYEDEYFKQMTAERVLIRRNRKGFSNIEWVKDRERNEVLDCRIYARAAASLFGMDRFKESDWLKFGHTKRLETSNNLRKHENNAEIKSENNSEKTASQTGGARQKRRESSFW